MGRGSGTGTQGSGTRTQGSGTRGRGTRGRAGTWERDKQTTPEFVKYNFVGLEKGVICWRSGELVG